MNEKKKRTKRTPEQRVAMKYAYWNKWCPGGSPDKVLRSKEIDYEDPWYVTKITPSELDQHYESEYNSTMIKQRKRTREDIQRIQDLRRSNASAKFRNKKKYNRKNNDWKKEA